MLGSGPTSERRVENASEDVAVVVSPSGEQAIRELRRVQHRAAVVVLPVGGGASGVADFLGSVWAAEGRRLVVVEVADPSAPVDWRALLDAVPSAPVASETSEPKRARAKKPKP